MGITKGELEFAKRRALNLFDKWNNVTRFVQEHTGYYYEIQSCIEDAVECGFQAAAGVHELLDSEKNDSNKITVKNYFDSNLIKNAVVKINEVVDSTLKADLRLVLNQPVETITIDLKLNLENELDQLILEAIHEFVDTKKNQVFSDEG
jgi:hypothetical protein